MFYENKSEDDLIKILSEPKTKTRLSKKKIRDIRKHFNESRYKFSKSKTKEIRKNVRKHKYIKLVIADKRRNELASEPNYHTPKYFSKNL